MSHRIIPSEWILYNTKGVVTKRRAILFLFRVTLKRRRCDLIVFTVINYYFNSLESFIKKLWISILQHFCFTFVYIFNSELSKKLQIKNIKILPLKAQNTRKHTFIMLQSCYVKYYLMYLTPNFDIYLIL